MARDITTWLKDLGLERYSELFVKNEIDFDVLPELTSEDLKELGLPLGPRRKVLSAAAVDLPSANLSMPSDDDGPTEPERRQLTVMFCDLVGSTSLAEQFDPEQMRLVIRSYQESVAEAIARFDGNIAKFMGDGVLAYFGWPHAHEDDAERAVRSGLAVAEAIDRQSAPDGRALRVRVGIATGLVVVGDLVGEGAARETAVVGATPNLAARLQGIATGNSVVISDATHVLIDGRFSCEALAPMRLRGFAEPVTAWRVMEPIEAESRFAATRGPHLTPLVGRTEELELLGRRWNTARAGAERYWDAELHRLKGDLLLQYPEPNPTQVETCFLQALEVARAQQAKSLELRAATSLSRLWIHEGRRAEARDLLAPVHDWFIEGFNTADLKDCQSLLDELS